MSPRARRSSGRSIWCFAATGETPASVFTRSLVVIEQGARAMLVESHDASAGHQVNTALELVVGDNAHVDHIKITGGPSDLVHVSSLMAAIGANARLQRFRLQHRRRRGAQPDLRSLRRRGHARGLARREPAQGQAARRFHAGDRSQGRRLPEPRGVRVRARRRKPRRVPGQDRGAAARAEDRRQDDDAGAAAVRRGRGRQQAGAGDFCRRRAVRPRRHVRRARRGPEVLSDGARHS